MGANTRTKSMNIYTSSPFPTISEGVFLVVGWLSIGSGRIAVGVIGLVLAVVHWWMRGVIDNLARRPLAEIIHEETLDRRTFYRLCVWWAAWVVCVVAFFV